MIHRSQNTCPQGVACGFFPIAEFKQIVHITNGCSTALPTNRFLVEVLGVVGIVLAFRLWKKSSSGVLGFLVTDGVHKSMNGISGSIRITSSSHSGVAGMAAVIEEILFRKNSSETINGVQF